MRFPLVSAWRARLAVGLAAGAACTVFLSSGATPASATQNGRYSIQPAATSSQSSREFFNYLLRPGDTVIDAVTVTNMTAQSMAFNLFTADAANAQGGGFAIKPPNAPKRTVGKWVSLSDYYFTLPPHTLANVPFTLKIPDHIEPGDYAGGIVLSPAVPAVEHRGHLTFDVYENVGARIYVRIAGKLHPGLAVTQLSVKTNGAAGLVGGPVNADVTYTLTNTGNQVLNPTATLSLSPLLGSTVKIPPRIFSSLLPHNSVTITYQFKSQEAFLHLGTSLKVSSGAGKIVAGATGWVIPWLLILVIVLVVLLIWWLLHRRRGKRERRGGGGDDELGEAGGGSPSGGEAPVEAAAGATEG